MASSLPTLSAIVPNYNHGALIARSLGALATQTPAGSEIIVVDDGSTDDSLKVIEELRTRYPAIHLVRHDHNRSYAVENIHHMTAPHLCSTFTCLFQQPAIK